MKPDTKIYILRGIFGLITAIICVIMDLRDFPGIMFGLAMYILTIPIIRNVLKIKASNLTAPEQIYLNGLAPYLAIWIITWTIVYTFQIPHLKP